MSYVTITQIHKQGGFTNAAGTVNFLRAIDSLKVRVDWEETQIGGLNLANIEMVDSFEDTTDFQAGNWVYYACKGGTLASNASAGATSLSVSNLGFQTSPNLAPNSTFLNGWHTTTNMVVAAGGPGGYTDFEYTGTGSPSNFEYANSPVIPVTAGQVVTFSCWVDPSHVTANPVTIAIEDPGLTTAYTTLSIPSGSPAGRYVCPKWIVPNGVTQVVILLDSQTATVASGQKLKFSQPMFRLDGTVSPYVPSDLPQSDIVANDYVLISDGINTDLMKVASVTGDYPGPWTVTIGAAPGQNTASLLNAYGAGATVARLQFSGYLLARNTRTTNLNGKYVIQVQGFATRYNNVLCNADIVQQDCATSVYNLCNSYATTLPEIIVSSSNFASANSYLCTTQSQNAKVMKVITDIIKTENSQNANVNYAFWVDRVRQAHHTTIPGANTATPSGNLGDPGTSHASPTYGIDIASPSNGSYYDAIGPLDAIDMDMSQMVNTAIVQGGQMSSKQTLSVIVEDQTSQNAWGYWEGVLSNPDLTDETTAAKWGAGQLCISAYPRTTAKTTFIDTPARLTCRDLLQLTGFSDSSVMQFNPTRIKYVADDRQRIITGDMDLAQARPDIGAIMNAGAHQVAIRTSTIKPTTNLDSIFVVSGLNLITSGLNVTVSAGVVSYGGTMYSIPSYSHTLGSTDSIQVGAQVLGTPPGGVTLPSVVEMPSRTALSKLYANNLYSITRPATQGSPITITATTNFLGVPLYRITSQNGAIIGKTDLRVIGGTTTNNLPKMPSGASFTASSISLGSYDSGAKTVYATSASVALHPLLTYKFTLAESTNPDMTAWGKCLVAYIRVQVSGNTTDATTYQAPIYLVDQSGGLANGTVCQGIIPGAVQPGQSYDVAMAVADHQGAQTSLVYLGSVTVPTVQSGAPIGPIIGKKHFVGSTSTNGTTSLYDNENDTLAHTIMSHGLQLAVDSSGNQLNLEFPGGKIQSDGSMTSISGGSSVTAYSLTTGQPFSACVDIAKGVIANKAELLLGNITNGYGVSCDTSGNWLVRKYVSGTATILQTFAGVNDTNYHTYRLTVVPGATNVIEASVDGHYFPVTTDSSLTLTAGTWPVTLYTGNVSGKAIHYIASGAPQHYGNAPVAVQGTIQNTLNGASYLKSGVIDDTHIHSVKLDTINDGTTYQRVLATELASGTVKQLNDGTNLRTAAALAGAIDSSSNLLASDFPSQTKHLTSGAYQGWEQVIGSYSSFNGSGALVFAKEVNGQGVSSNMLWCEWTVIQSTTTNNVTVGFTDGSGTGFLGANFGSGAGNLIVTTGSTKAWSSGGSLASNSLNDGLVHTVRVGVSYVSGANPTAVWRIVVYADGVKVADANVTGNFNNAQGYASIGCSGSSQTLYVRDFRWWVGGDAFEKMHPDVVGAFGYTGSGYINALTSKIFKSSTTSVMPFTTNFNIVVTINSSNNHALYYISNGTSGTGPTFYMSDNTQISAPALGTSTSPIDSGQVVSSGQTGYVLAYFKQNDTSGQNGTGWHVAVQTSQFTAAQQAAAFIDGGLLASIAQKSNNSFTGGGGGGSGGGGLNGCPEVNEPIEVRREGRIITVRAGDLRAGDELRDFEPGAWNTIRKFSVGPAIIYEVSFYGKRSRKVDSSHLFVRRDGTWVNVKELRTGDKIARGSSKTLTIRSVKEVGWGEMAHITCDNARYLWEEAGCHNVKMY